MSDIGGTVNITCTADGLPEPRVVWKRNGTVIVTENSETRQRWMVTNESGRPGFRTQVPTNTFVSSRLVIKQILEADNNTQLTCLAINNFGQSATKNYTLIVEPSKCIYRSYFDSDIPFCLQVSISVCLTHVAIRDSVIQILTLSLFFVFAHKAILVNFVNKVTVTCITVHEFHL